MNNELEQLNESLRKLETMVEEFVFNNLEMAKQIDKTRKVVDEYLKEGAIDDHDCHNGPEDGCDCNQLRE